MAEMGGLATGVLPSAADINASALRIVERACFGNVGAAGERHGSFQAEPPLRAWASTEAAGLS